MTTEDALARAIALLAETEALLRDCLLPEGYELDQPGQGQATTLLHRKWRAIQHAVHVARAHLEMEQDEQRHAA